MHLVTEARAVPAGSAGRRLRGRATAGTRRCRGVAARGAARVGHAHVAAVARTGRSGRCRPWSGRSTRPSPTRWTIPRAARDCHRAVEGDCPPTRWRPASEPAAVIAAAPRQCRSAGRRPARRQPTAGHRLRSGRKVRQHQHSAEVWPVLPATDGRGPSRRWRRSRRCHWPAPPIPADAPRCRVRHRTSRWRPSGMSGGGRRCGLAPRRLPRQALTPPVVSGAARLSQASPDPVVAGRGAGGAASVVVAVPSPEPRHDGAFASRRGHEPEEAWTFDAGLDDGFNLSGRRRHAVEQPGRSWTRAILVAFAVLGALGGLGYYFGGAAGTWRTGESRPGASCGWSPSRSVRRSPSTASRRARRRCSSAWLPARTASSSRSATNPGP